MIRPRHPFAQTPTEREVTPFLFRPVTSVFHALRGNRDLHRAVSRCWLRLYGEVRPANGMLFLRGADDYPHIRSRGLRVSRTMVTRSLSSVTPARKFLVTVPKVRYRRTTGESIIEETLMRQRPQNRSPSGTTDTRHTPNHLRRLLPDAARPPLHHAGYQLQPVLGGLWCATCIHREGLGLKPRAPTFQNPGNAVSSGDQELHRV